MLNSAPSNANLTIVIADDEAPARNRLRDLLTDIENVSLVGEAKNGKDAISVVEDKKPDLLLLDIRMPVMDGIEAATHLQKLTAKPHIIFTTAYDNHALQAFELNAIDYLLKPIRLERLQTAINKVRMLQAALLSALTQSQLDAIKPLRAARSHFSISERGRIVLVPMAEVIYLRAELKYVTVRTKEREYLIEESLKTLENEFAESNLGESFIRLHRNCLVAKSFITRYEKRANVINNEEYGESDSGNGDTHWVAILKEIPDTIAISRRQQHLVRAIR